MRFWSCGEEKRKWTVGDTELYALVIRVDIDVSRITTRPPPEPLNERHEITGRGFQIFHQPLPKRAWAQPKPYLSPILTG